MRDWRISTTGQDPIPAHELATRAYPLPSSPRTYLLTGTSQTMLAACAQAAIQAGHRVVLPPGPPVGSLPDGTLLETGDQGVHDTPVRGVAVRGGWDVAMFSSGSTTGIPSGYGFTRDQLDAVTAWYQTIYRVTADSAIVTALPAHYNFTFVAGVLLAARVGAHLHISGSAEHVLGDAARLAAGADRLVVLANPVILDQVTPNRRLPDNVMIDSGGAALSTTAIMDYREHGIDVREGYGLTETASLTHFDAEPAVASLGTVGAAMPGAHATINVQTGKPIIELSSPSIGIPLDLLEPLAGGTLRTTDVGSIDDHGRLRLLGRYDDEPINGIWPRDTLDILGPLLGRRCALVRHYDGATTVRLLTPVDAKTADALRNCAVEALGLQPSDVVITDQGNAPLLHSAKLTRQPAGAELAD